MTLEAGGSSLAGRSVALRVDVIDRGADGRDLLCVFIGDRDSELIFELHDELDSVERVSSEVVDEGGVSRDLVGRRAQLIADNLDDLFFDGGGIRHLRYLFLRLFIAPGDAPSRGLMSA